MIQNCSSEVLELSFYQYWGKAKKQQDSLGADYHLLAYHCLDVAAIAKAWWRASASLRRRFCQQSGLNEEQTQAWLLFFISLHDLGKFDIRFQLKAGDVWNQVNPDISQHGHRFSKTQIDKYYHGPAAVYWLFHDWKYRFSDRADDDYLLLDEEDNASWQAWFSWLAPVAGHHGSIAKASDKDERIFEILHQAASATLEILKNDRQSWYQILERLFLKPVGLSLENDPPELADGILLAGFCSVADWLGSCADDGAFEYDKQPPINSDLKNWFESRLPIARKLLQKAGLSDYRVCPAPDISKLLKNYPPRQVQCLVGQLPVEPGLTLIEASTGSGKTEAALAHAWQLLDSGLADSIVFALPTQATANAMLSRVEKAAKILFKGEINTVLAHGRARFQKDFINLRQAVMPETAQQKEEAWVQCAQWLAESKKRVFLGQLGVCTVDQVLVSVLPVRHKFVRGFGIGRSVLIIDEVHAYDQYMYGLLEAVLRQQKATGGSAILLSATLPERQKQQLLNTWSNAYSTQESVDLTKIPYPLVTVSTGQIPCQTFAIEKASQLPEATTVYVEVQQCSEILPDDTLLERMINAAEQGTQVALVCNLVDVAQQTLERLRQKATGRLTNEQLMLFHSRFVFSDRQKIEEKVVERFGPEGDRQKGHILVSTQVFECSIDADMDWMISQLCPVDLLFQRWGRLHRHNRSTRPEGFDQPVCTVLVPDSESYELHDVIYGDSRILWRTQQLLEQSGGRVEFPGAYREWIEPVYQEDDWGTEPEWVLESHDKFTQHQGTQRNLARLLISSGISDLEDNDSNVSALTRDGDMNQTVVPVIANLEGKRSLLDGILIDALDDSNRVEMISLNSLGVPATWNQKKSKGQLPEPDESGVIWLEMKKVKEGFEGCCDKTTYNYSPDTGLKRFKGD